jgi:hypothetical protein
MVVLSKGGMTVSRGERGVHYSTREGGGAGAADKTSGRLKTLMPRASEGIYRAKVAMYNGVSA